MGLLTGLLQPLGFYNLAASREGKAYLLARLSRLGSDTAPFGNRHSYRLDLRLARLSRAILLVLFFRGLPVFALVETMFPIPRR